MNIRPYQNADLGAVARLFTASVHELGAARYNTAQRAAWAPQPPDPQEWQRRLAAIHTLLAEDDDSGELAGFISYRHEGHIELLYTAPAFARCGVASRLYQRVEPVLIAAGARVLVTEASLVARPFFERQGFRVVEEQRVCYRGEWFRRYAMRKTMPGMSQDVGENSGFPSVDRDM